MTSMSPQWKVSCDWFDVCKCNIPCPCTFAQAQSDGECQGVLAYHINNGIYGETSLNGLNVIIVGGFKGNAWAREAKDAVGAFFFDERSNENQREALQMIFMGRAGGFMAEFAKTPTFNSNIVFGYLWTQVMQRKLLSPILKL
jgi:hypothetical protein